MEIIPEDFLQIRSTNMYNYKKLCAALLKIQDAKILLKAAVGILQTPPAERMEMELQILQKATIDLDFIKQLQDDKVHAKCCRSLTYRYIEKGQIIFKQGDPSGEFFIIVDGQANVYVSKTETRIKHEINTEAKLLETLTPEQIEVRPTQVLASFCAKKQQNPKRRLSVVFDYKDFVQLNQVLKLDTQKKDQMTVSIKPHKNAPEVAIISELTNGLENLADRDFLIEEGIFKHDYIMTLSDGQVFGERGILIESKRTGTLIATTDIHLAVLKRSDFKAFLEDNHLDKLRKKLRLLSQTFLKCTNYKEAMQCQFWFNKVSYPLGSNIYRIGDPTDSIYVIKKGSVRILSKGHHQRQVALRELGPEQYFGDVEFLEQCDRYQTVQAITTKVSLYVISTFDMQKVEVSAPAVLQMLRNNYQQRKSIEDVRVDKQLKIHKKFQSMLNSPVIYHEPNNDPKIYDIFKPKQSLCLMEQISKTATQLKAIRRIQKQELKKQSKTVSLADTLMKLERQQSLYKKEIRKQEQLRFSSIANTQSDSIATHKHKQKPELDNSIKAFDSMISPQSQPSSTNSVLISSKHNLFRSKPRREMLLTQYERKLPKTYSSEISMQYNPYNL